MRSFWINNTKSRRLRRGTISALVAAAILGSGWLSYSLTLKSSFEELTRAANDRLTLFVLTLDATVERFRYLPTVLAQADPVLRIFEDFDSPAVVDATNRYLQSLNEVAGSSDLYIVNDQGITLAASNYLKDTTFVGENYAFRPYFKEALRSSEGRYYAVGATTGKPGYFLWHSIVDASGQTLGVAVVKVV